MIRRDDWPDRLHLIVRQRKREPFAWGRHDCALFACDAIEAMTDVDLGWSFRGNYASEEEAGDRIREFCQDAGAVLTDVVEILANEYGLIETPVPFAGRGDLVSIEAAGKPSLGIMVDARAAFAGEHGRAGLVMLPRGRIKRAWKV